MNTDVMFSSKYTTWETPQWLFDELNKEFNFTLDVCADINTHKCEAYYDEETDGLSQNWQCPIEHNTVAWMNPPYGRQISKWIEKAYNEALIREVVTVALLPARTDTKWFHDFIYNKHEIRFLKGRLKFGKAVNSAPFPSMIVIFKNKNI